MKAAFAKIGDSIISRISRKLGLTGCFTGCHRPEDLPEDMFK